PEKRNGFFVDIGAHDGVSLSNTLYLEEKLGWTGLAIEPNPEVYKRLSINRRCSVLQGCVAACSGKQKFRVLRGVAEMLSGLVDEYDPRHETRIRSAVTMQPDTQEEIEVDCFTLNELLDQHSIRSVDYLSIDTEGSELSILR